MDFTLKTYSRLYKILLKQGFSLSPFGVFLIDQQKRVIVLRHDVDALPHNSLNFARIQSDNGFFGTYYFRTVPGSFDEKIIREIYSLGHEVGYHYEDLNFAWEKLRAQGSGFKRQDRNLEQKLAEIGIESFNRNLNKLRGIAPVKTICMHGNPMSMWDNRLLWKYYDYHDFGIIGEPYFDINFNEVFYLTDTGRCWDGNSFNVRDKAQDTELMAQGKQNQGPGTQELTPFSKFHSTFDIIKAAEAGQLPNKVMMTFHPQRWTDKLVPWVKELVWQNVKNVGKFLLIKK